MSPEKKHSNPSVITISDIPDGFIRGTGPNNKEYLVPEFMLPALQHGFAAREHKEELGVSKAQAGELQVQNTPYDTMAGGYILYPPDPPLSEQELLSVHANILALQQQFGISYKDAAHRLYMAQVERLKVSHAAYQALKRIDDELDIMLRSVNE